MDFEKVIKERYSVRKFQDKPLKKSDIDKIINASHIAPTGCNIQPQRILVINSEESVNKLKSCTKCHFDAPCAFLICYNSDETWTRPYDGAKSAPVDASIVTCHMMLEAHNIGVGSCWVMHFDPKKMREEFNIPDNFTPHALLVAGYPHKDSVPMEMHEKVRDINEVVYYDSF